MSERATERFNLTVPLTEDEAYIFAQFLKRSTFSTFSECAVDQSEAYQMIYASDRFRTALAQAGFAPR